MDDDKTPFNKEIIELLLLFTFLILYVRSHAQSEMNSMKVMESKSWKTTIVIGENVDGNINATDKSKIIFQ